MIHDFQDNNPNSRASVGSKRREFYSQLAQKAGSFLCFHLTFSYAESVGEELYRAWQHERNHVSTRSVFNSSTTFTLSSPTCCTCCTIGDTWSL